jgi:hypothetical protein
MMLVANQKGSYTAIIGMLTIVAIIAVAYSTAAYVSHERMRLNSALPLQLKDFWINMRIILDKATSDATANWAYNQAFSSCSADTIFAGDDPCNTIEGRISSVLSHNALQQTGIDCSYNPTSFNCNVSRVDENTYDISVQFSLECKKEFGANTSSYFKVLYDDRITYGKRLRLEGVAGDCNIFVYDLQARDATNAPILEVTDSTS